LTNATFVDTLTQHHRDLVDGLLIAQCTIEATHVVTADVTFDLYGVNRLW